MNKTIFCKNCYQPINECICITEEEFNEMQIKNKKNKLRTRKLERILKYD